MLAQFLTVVQEEPEYHLLLVLVARCGEQVEALFQAAEGTARVIEMGIVEIMNYVIDISACDVGHGRNIVGKGIDIANQEECMCVDAAFPACIGNRHVSMLEVDTQPGKDKEEAVVDVHKVGHLHLQGKNLFHVR
jgi:hypothetical protein